ncbi:MAG: cytochrome c [Alphaproteobacteria bacterium]|nr:cytochrome c [Alphaproteobacteria bacterium]
MKRMLSLVVTTAALLLALPASAQFAKPEDAIKYRKSALTVMGTHWARLAGMAQGRIPYDAKAAADNAAVLEVAHKLPWAAFGADTQSGDTKAKSEIWKEPAKFKEAEERLFAEVPKIVAAARSGKQDDLKAAFAAGGGVCKNCHDNFRQ